MILSLLILGFNIAPIADPTRFRLVHENGADWFVRPDGRKLWSFGVCCIGQGATPKTYTAKNPEYAAYRFYTSPNEWATDTLDRLTSWGFNTVGAWSDDKTLAAPKQADIVFTPILNIGASAGAPWHDMWDPKVVKTMDDVARVQIQAHHGDPRVLGYFSDNEMGWWYAAMFDWAFKAGPASRGHIVDLFSRIYHGSWSALLRDFDPDHASNFSALRKSGRLFLRPGGNGMHAVQAWMGVVSDRYYTLCRSIIKRYDPGALYLGDRYISNFYPEVARSAGRSCDVVSTNLNADTNRGDFAPFYLPTLHAITGRPLMITEYYVAAQENNSGNQNNSSGFPVVQTQHERADVFTADTLRFERTPYVVGAHWFQYSDEPGRGRGDGENYDMGLVDVNNWPYAEMVSRISHLSKREWVPLYAEPDAPYRTRKTIPFADLPGSLNISDWIGSDRYVPPAGSPDQTSARGDLYFGYDGGDLFLAIYWNEDRFADAFYRNAKIPESDRAKLTLTVNGKTVTGRFGDGRPPTLSGLFPVGFGSGVRNYAIVRVPAVDVPLHLDATFETRARAYRMHWKGTYAFKKS